MEAAYLGLMLPGRQPLDGGNTGVVLRYILLTRSTLGLELYILPSVLDRQQPPTLLLLLGLLSTRVTKESAACPAPTLPGQPRQQCWSSQLLEGALQGVTGMPAPVCRFEGHRAVAEPPSIRFYAAAPIVASTGQRLGAL